jgi:hypothetical protein
MATTYLPGATRPANPSRRAFIGAVSLAIPLAAAAAASPMLSSTNREWDRLVAEFHRADAHMKAVEPEHTAAEEAFFAARDLLVDQPKAPHVEYPRPIHEMTIGELREFAAPAHEQERHAAAVADWMMRSDEAKRRTMGDIEDRWNDAVSEQEAAVQAVLAHPAPDAAALLFKLELAEREYDGFDLDAKVGKHLFADVRHFVRGEA